MRPITLALLLAFSLPVALPPAQAQTAVATMPVTSITALKSEVNEAMNAQNWPHMATLAKRMVDQDPQNSDGHHWLGLALTQMGDIARAIPPRRRAAELQPDYADNWNGLCWTLILANQPAEAQSACEKAASLDPTNWPALVNLGHTFLLQGDAKSAQGWYQMALLYIDSDRAFENGPLADFNTFIDKGWKVRECRQARTWFMQAWPNWQTAMRLKNEADQLKAAGKYRQALPLARQSLQATTKTLGNFHPITGFRLSDVAILLQLTGSNAHAEPLFVRALAITEKILGPEHPDTGISLDNLAELYRTMGQYARAEPLYIRALAISEAANGLEHLSTSNVLNNLGLLYQAMGQYARAEAFHLRAISITDKHLGPEHPTTGISLNNLALLYQSIGQFAKAEELFIRAVNIGEKHLGPTHPDTGVWLNNLAGLYQQLGQYDRAEPLYSRALAISEKSNGPNHPSTARQLNNLALLYQVMGRYKHAEPLARRALAIGEKYLGPEHPDAGVWINNLALLYYYTGQYARAEPLMLRTLAISEKVEGPEHPSTGIRLNNLAGLYEAMKKPTRAEPLLLRAWRIATNAGNPSNTWIAQKLLLAFYTDTQPDLAIWYGKQAVNTLQSVRAGNTGLDKETQKSFLEKNETTYKSLADLLFAQGRLTEGQQVLAMLKEAEYFDFVQRSSASDPRKTQAGFTEQERPWSERYNQISNQLAALGKEREGLLKRVKNGETLAADELARKEKIDADLAVARQAYDAFMVDLKKEFTQNTGADRQQEFGEKNLASLRALQGTLRDLGHGAVTLHYLMTDKRLWILLTTPTVQLKREAAINAADLNRQIGQYREAIARRDPKIKELGKALYALLIGPVADDLQQAGAQTLMLSLDGSLRYLPMAALYDGERFVAQRYQLALYTSAATDKLKDKPQASWSLAGYGLTRKVEDFSALPSVKSELEGILLDMPGQVKFDQAFTAQAFKSGLENEPPVVHLASHFVFEPGNETNSFLLLGDGQRLSLKEIKDGYEFVNLDLLTLSACETAVGGGKDANGREVEGFGALAQNQGAKGVLATLWPVADESTGQFMQLFYGIRQKNPGMTKAAAMQLAQLAFIEGRVGSALAEVSRGAKRREAGKTAPVDATDHPYFWAPFILMGNWL
ncbi:CHAT domain-containing protein [Quatrionicoccus australiensis]|uniref:CHAT domain-containing protein n=1 Tax=Quatrionicoccus australiensis TaxID=138118 RepID=UPI001CF9D36E|nr:tetratricopeptide repeat protein [Quatrionicoccus australiensis]MCB4361422.1 tetratricopeptide repeat protein [Quatrionicoccus australiensis]